jgi:hypothetical protein
LAGGGRVGDALALWCLYDGAAPTILHARPTNSVRDGCLNIGPSSNYIIAI